MNTSPGLSFVIGAAMCVLACGSDGPGTGGVDAGAASDGGTSGLDASVEDCRLQVQFSIDPDVPGLDPSGATVDRVTFELKSFRLISDTTGGQGSPETTRDEVTLTWSTDEVPAALCFPQAPEGIYQQVLFQIDKYRVDGELAEPDGREFTVDDKPPSLNGSSAIMPTVDLGPTGTETIELEFSVEDIIFVLDENKGDLPGGEIEITDEYPDSELLEELREAAEDALDD